MSSLAKRPDKSRKGAEPANFYEDWFREAYGFDASESPTYNQGKPPAERPPRGLRRAVDRAQRRRQAPPAPTARKLRTEAKKRKESERQKRERRNHRYFYRARDELLHAWLMMGIPTDYVKVIPRDVWVMCWHIVADDTGEAARYYLRRCRNKTAAGALWKAATADGRRPWTSPTARALVAEGLALYALSQNTNKYGRWRRIVRGIRQKVLAALVTLPGARRPHVNTIAGKSKWNGHYTHGEIGHLPALRQAGFCIYQQLPPEKVAPWERCHTPRGPQAINRYWIIGNNPLDAANPEHRRQILELAQEELERLAQEEQEELEQLEDLDDQEELAGADLVASRAPP